jgi:hypothetical protein
MSYHGYKLLGIKIASQLRLEVANRTEDGHEFLTEIMTEYRNLFESSNVLTKTFPDKLLRPIPVLDPINPLLPIVSPRGS